MFACIRSLGVLCKGVTHYGFASSVLGDLLAKHSVRSWGKDILFRVVLGVLCKGVTYYAFLA